MHSMLPHTGSCRGAAGPYDERRGTAVLVVHQSPLVESGRRPTSPINASNQLAHFTEGAMANEDQDC